MTCTAVPAGFRSNAFSHTFLCIITVNISTNINAIVIFLPLSPYFPSFLMYIKRVFSLFALLISNDMPFCRTTLS